MKEVLEIFRDVMEKTPQILGLALFDSDGFMLVSLMNVPHYDEEAAAAFHADLWYEINRFVSSLPEDMDGPLRSAVLELKIANLQMVVMGEYGIMGATTSEVGVGALRKIIEEIAPKVLKAVEEIP